MNEDEKKNENKSEGSEHESDDENEILEESPCGRWLKRSEEVSQRNVPGIDRAYLAMDSEEGVEVVWNEVQFSERKSFNKQAEKIKSVFDNLMKIDHANIVKFHRYWIDIDAKESKEQQKTRVVFITEYMSSGSVKEFLNKTKELQSSKRNKSWKRWCTQILSALNYLHSCSPPVIHGNMTCDTIFIQHNGLVKIGSVAPDAIRNHVKTYNEVKHLHYYAPEYEMAQNITPAVDIFSFGICALEMAVPRFHLQHQSKTVTPTDIANAINLLDNPQQKDFIQLCLREDPTQRPSARSLLLHPLLFEVHSLKLLAAHAFVKNDRSLPEYKQTEQNKDREVGKTIHKSVKAKDLPLFDVDKFLEDVQNGVYPLTSYAMPHPPWAPEETSPQEVEGKATEGHKPSGSTEEVTPETRKIIYAQGIITPLEKGSDLILQLRFEDKMNRHLNCEMTSEDSAEALSAELLEHKLIREGDKEMIKKLIEDLTKKQQANKGTVHTSCGNYGAEQGIARALMEAFKPEEPTIDHGYVLYQNMQNQMLPKQPVPSNGLEDHVTPVFQSVPNSVQAINPIMIQNQAYAPAFIGTPTMSSQQENPLSTTNHLAKQLASVAAPVARPVTLPMQYFPILQPQAATHTAISSQNQMQAVPNMLQNLQYQQLVSHQLQLQHLQPVYGIQSPQLAQINPVMQPIQIATNIPQGANSQSLINPGMVHPVRQTVRVANSDQRGVYSAMPQSSNNSNNTSFSRSTSRVDESSSQHLPASTAESDAPPPTPTATESFKIG